MTKNVLTRREFLKQAACFLGGILALRFKNLFGQRQKSPEPREAKYWRSDGLAG